MCAIRVLSERTKSTPKTYASRRVLCNGKVLLAVMVVPVDNSERGVTLWLLSMVLNLTKMSAIRCGTPMLPCQI